MCARQVFSGYNFSLMKRVLLFAAILAAVTGNLASEPNKSPATHEQKVTESTPTESGCVTVVENTPRSEPTETATHKPPKWYATPEAALVIVGIITAGFICWQSWETRKAAKAAENNIEVLIAKERARIYIEPDGFAFDPYDEYDPTYELKYKITCAGTTPAIIFFSHVAAEISVSQRRDEPERGDQIPLPNNVVPGVIELRTSLAGDRKHFNDILDEQIESGELFVNFWGYINYRDIFFKGNGFWRKNFRYIWDPQKRRFLRCGEPWENSESKKEARNPN
jgi:hypothetical protein